MNKPAAVAAVLCAGSLFALPTRSDTASGVRRTLQALYDKGSAAIARKDVMGATAFDAPDFVIIDAQGQSHTLAQSRERAAQLWKRPQLVKVTVNIDRVDLKGKTATADVHQHMIMRWVNPKTSHVFQTEQWTTNTDLWSKSSTTWLRTQSRTKTIRVMLNGKEVLKR